MMPLRPFAPCAALGRYGLQAALHISNTLLIIPPPKHVKKQLGRRPETVNGYLSRSIRSFRGEFCAKGFRGETLILEIGCVSHENSAIDQR